MALQKRPPKVRGLRGAAAGDAREGARPGARKPRSLRITGTRREGVPAGKCSLEQPGRFDPGVTSRLPPSRHARMQWDCQGLAKGLQQACNGLAIGLQGPYNELARALHWDDNRLAIGLQGPYRGLTMSLQGPYTGLTTGLQQPCHRFIVGLQYGCNKLVTSLQ